jgi:hypothetical protein
VRAARWDGQATERVVKRYWSPRSGHLRYLVWPLAILPLVVFGFVADMAVRDPSTFPRGAVALVPVPVLTMGLAAIVTVAVITTQRRRAELVQRVDVWSGGRVVLHCLRRGRDVAASDVVGIERDMPRGGDAEIILADGWTGILPGAAATREDRKALARLHHVIRVAAGDAPPRPSDEI